MDAIIGSIGLKDFKWLTNSYSEENHDFYYALSTGTSLSGLKIAFTNWQSNGFIAFTSIQICFSILAKIKQFSIRSILCQSITPNE